MTDREQDREAFEKWARDHHYPLRPSMLQHYPIRPIGHAGQEREYGAWDTDAAWQAWQAATAAAAERIAELQRQQADRDREAWNTGFAYGEKFASFNEGLVRDLRYKLADQTRYLADQTRYLQHANDRIAQLERERDEARADAERLRALINTPQTDDWLTAMRPGIDEAAIRARKEGS